MTRTAEEYPPARDRQRPPRIYAIGFSGRTLPNFVDALLAAGVERLIDIRARAGARFKPDFNKGRLRDALAAAGIEYVHLKLAGNPYRKEWKADLQEGIRLYTAHLDEHSEVIDALEQAVAGKVSAIMCLEATTPECHRSVLIERLNERKPGLVVKEL